MDTRTNIFGCGCHYDIGDNYKQTWTKFEKIVYNNKKNIFFKNKFYKYNDRTKSKVYKR